MQYIRNGYPSNLGRQLPTLSQSRQKELVKALANWFSYLYTNVYLQVFA